MAVLARMANLEHAIEIGEGDTVILASSLIPGNENAVYRVIDGLTKLGANVVHKGNAKVHVSGHAAAGELLYCYNILKPQERAAGPRRVPAPGRERAARAGHRRPRASARSSRENGTVIDLTDGVAQRRRPARPRLRLRRRLDASARSPTPTSRTAASSARRGSSRSSSSVDAATGRSSSVPRSTPAGFAEDDAVFEDVQAEDRRGAAPRPPRTGVRDPHALSQVVRRTVGRWVNQKLPPPPDDRAARHRGVAAGPRRIRRPGTIADMAVSSASAPPCQADGAFLGDMVVEAANWRAGRPPPEAPDADRARPQPLRRRVDAPGRRRLRRRRRDRRRRSAPPGTGCCRAAIPGFGYVGTGVPELIIGVRPIWRAHGVGRALLQRLCASRRARDGYARLSLSVERGNFAATLYRSEGFAVTQSGIGRDTMVKRLR